MKVPARPDRRARYDAQVAELAAALARAVRSGATLRVALHEVLPSLAPPLRGDVAMVVELVERGVGVDAALSAWRTGRESAPLDLLVAGARFGHAEGGDLGTALDAVTVAVHDRLEVAAEARALSTQARTSGTVLVALPVIGAVSFSVLDPGVAQLLLTTPLGWACLAVGVSLDLAGLASIRLLTRRALR